MTLTDSERKRILSIIELRTDYNLDRFEKMPDSQLYAASKNIVASLNKRVEAIEKYYQKNPDTGNFTYKDLCLLGLTELNAIIESLGINIKKQRVVKTEPAPKKTMTEAKDRLESQKRSYLAAQIILSEKEHEDVILDPISDSYAIKQYFKTTEEALAAGYATYSDEYRYESDPQNKYHK